MQAFVHELGQELASPRIQSVLTLFGGSVRSHMSVLGNTSLHWQIEQVGHSLMLLPQGGFRHGIKGSF